MTQPRAFGVRRLLAFAVDWTLLAVWGGLLFGIAMIVSGGTPAEPTNPWIGQAVSMLTMTMPFTLYFAFAEHSALRASLGKRLLGLGVSHESGARLSFGSALLRNAVKFTPWECGHTVAWQSIFAGDAAFPAWVWGPAIVAIVGPAWWLVTLFGAGRTPYDRLASARVAAAPLTPE